MAILTDDQLEYLYNTIENTRSLLDNVHCYDTEENDALGVCLNILNGQTVEEAERNYKEEIDG
ncbi:hypothetical protein ACX818_001425 [Acinetobacter baumannii]